LKKGAGKDGAEKPAQGVFNDVFNAPGGGKCSANGETRTHDRRFTKPVLYQLSYIGVLYYQGKGIILTREGFIKQKKPENGFFFVLLQTRPACATISGVIGLLRG
jgi:hypothetical protein